MQIDELYNIFLLSKGVSTDTRTIIEGQLFFGLKGANFDGNQKAHEALLCGASYCIVDDASVVKGDKFVLVNNVLETLQELAGYHRNTIEVPVLGITGSNGKTTTKELIRQVLSTRYSVACTQGNYNNHIGLPLTLLNQPRDADIWILEMGTNAPGNIQELSEIGKPNLGLITNIGSAHLEQLVNQEGVYYEKVALFNSVVKANGTIFINEEDQWLKKYDKTKEVIFYSSADIGGLELRLMKSDNNRLEIEVQGEADIYNIKSNLTGNYNLQNISAAIAVGQYFNIPIVEICDAISNYRPNNMRSQVQQTEKNLLVIDAYNANPSSMRESILSHLLKVQVDLVFILGDMLELGLGTKAYHESILDLIGKNNAQIITVGPIFYSCDNRINQRFKSVEDLISSGILQNLRDQEVLIKGSRGIKLEKVIPFL